MPGVAPYWVVRRPEPSREITLVAGRGRYAGDPVAVPSGTALHRGAWNVICRTIGWISAPRSRGGEPKALGRATLTTECSPLARG